LSVAVRKAFSNVYPDKEVLNKTTILQLVTTFRFGMQEVLVCDMCSWSNKTAEIMAVPISSSALATTGYGCKNSILPLVLPFCV
jgi:hypothetical protein